MEDVQGKEGGPPPSFPDVGVEEWGQMSAQQQKMLEEKARQLEALRKEVGEMMERLPAILHCRSPYTLLEGVRTMMQSPTASTISSRASSPIPAVPQDGNMTWVQCVAAHPPPLDDPEVEMTLEEEDSHGKVQEDLAVRLVEKDMAMYGHQPLSDALVLVTCMHCNNPVKDSAFAHHMRTQHPQYLAPHHLARGLSTDTPAYRPGSAFTFATQPQPAIYDPSMQNFDLPDFGNIGSGAIDQSLLGSYTGAGDMGLDLGDFGINPPGSLESKFVPILEPLDLPEPPKTEDGGTKKPHGATNTQPARQPVPKFTNSATNLSSQWGNTRNATGSQQKGGLVGTDTSKNSAKIPPSQTSQTALGTLSGKVPPAPPATAETAETKKPKPLNKGSFTKHGSKGKDRGYDMDTICGVSIPSASGGHPLTCKRSLTCKAHSMGSKRAVMGRSKPFDTLLAALTGKPLKESLRRKEEQREAGSEAGDEPVQDGQVHVRVSEMPRPMAVKDYGATRRGCVVAFGRRRDVLRLRFAAYAVSERTRHHPTPLASQPAAATQPSPAEPTSIKRKAEETDKDSKKVRPKKTNAAPTTTARHTIKFEPGAGGTS